MTLKELLEWAEKNGCLDCDVCVQYRDDGGLYYGEDFDIDPPEWKKSMLKMSLYCRKEKIDETS